MGFPNGGEGGEGSPTWEKFPHFPVFLFGERPLHDDLQVNLESLGDALHRKDYYGKEAISEPQVCQFFSRYFLEVPYFDKIHARCGPH